MSSGAKQPVGQTSGHFQKYNLSYLIHLPARYYATQKKWPFLLFLHGAGEKGYNLESLKRHGPPKIVEKQKDFPFIVVSPQCQPHQYWNSAALMALIEDIIANYQVDTSRLYVTGLSMGGFGTWDLAIQYPERFAAIVPVCGGGNQKNITNICNIKHLPVWVFHGAKDDIVPLIYSQVMVDALEKCGGNVKFTVYLEAAHDSWTETYNNPAVYEWLLQHQNVNQ